ncbi:glutaredoxin [Aeromicrobium marinum DSM 15272]|uniref:Glutaredoxin n=1 Tax=Aeromicrobium marinum DSM 15272 TaxID=585531 RepID=E2SE30_9ACTN|nr:glutaredoxin domain-containing protein [Aeromicrobium marinum]EFQ82757.1 glutaredoxin [Aeromicrobium marinum DSM 15272]
MRRTLPATLFLLGAIAAVVSGLTSGDAATATVLAAVLATAGLLVSPLPFPGSAPTAQWQRVEGAGGVVVLFRPGCPFCLKLRFAVSGLAGRATWADIWADDAAAARVREATGGDETVPTVLIDGEAHVNPDPSWLRARLAATSA